MNSLGLYGDKDLVSWSFVNKWKNLLFFSFIIIVTKIIFSNQHGNSQLGSDLLNSLANGQQLGSPNLSDGCLDEEDEELMYNEDDNEDGVSLTGSSNGYSRSDSFSEEFSSSNQAETHNSLQQANTNSIASILGASNTSLMNNMNSMLNTVLNNSVKQEEKLAAEDNNLPSSPESASGSLNNEDEETAEQ